MSQNRQMVGSTLARGLWRVALAACVLVPAAGAWASGDNEAHVVQLNAFDNTNTVEVSALSTMQVNSKFSNGLGGGFTLSYQFAHYVGVEGGYFYLFKAEETDTTALLRETIATAASGGDRAVIPWYGTLALRFVPIYGKFSFFGLDTAFLDLYLVTGLGFLGTEEGNVTKVESGTAGEFKLEAGPKQMAGVLGGGLRFFALRWLVVRIEIRDLMFTTSGANALDTNNQLKESAFRNNLYGMLGVGFVF